MTFLLPVSMKVQITRTESGPQYKRFAKLASPSKQTEVEHSTQRKQVTVKIMIFSTQLFPLVSSNMPGSEYFLIADALSCPLMQSVLEASNP
ncbi:hypothetical protein HN011_005104 [Eciton burchellii]|nr:hypothetical protein HN011_005104 [Eciton burchellii]